MTFDILQKIIKENNIPSNVHLTSDSGWECDATEMNGVYYNEAKNEIVFTQEGSVYDYSYRDSYSWKNIYSSSTATTSIKAFGGFRRTFPNCW